jgi:hypothetical protein
MLTKTSTHGADRAPRPDDAALAGMVDQIAESEAFRAAPVMRKILLYLWQTRGESISEYAIATEALGRPADFDTRTDASVRVQVARLRAKLTEFYARREDDFPLQLRIPLGSHELEWFVRPHPRDPQAPPELAETPPPAKSWKVPFVVACAVAGALMIVCIVLALRHNPAAASTAAVTSLPRFWKSFLETGKPVDIVVPNQTGFRWPGQGIYVIDPKTADFNNWPRSPQLAALAEKWGPPSLNLTFVFGRDALAGFSVQQYLNQHGRQAQVIEGANFAGGLASANDTILLGLPSASPQLRQLGEKMNFRVSRNIPLVIENVHPSGGEPARYEEVQLSEKRRICPAVLVLLPRKTDGARTLLLVGRFANVLAATVVSAEGLNLIDKAWSGAGAPNAWEMLIQAEIENNTTIIRVWPVSTRPVAANFWN